MSHLASADSAGVPYAADAAFTDEQLERFRELAERFPDAPPHRQQRRRAARGRRPLGRRAVWHRRARAIAVCHLAGR